MCASFVCLINVHSRTFFCYNKNRGDSITEYFDLERFMPAIDHKYNCGIGGITSNMLLHFVDEGVLKYEPEQVSFS